MSADLIRRAAARLREHAEAATPGPWDHTDDGEGGSFMGCGQVITWGEGVEGGDIAGPTGDCYPRGGYSPRDDMAFIALLDPPVALALAELLDAEAALWRPNTIPANETGARRLTALAAMGRAILREPEDGTS